MKPFLKLNLGPARSRMHLSNPLPTRMALAIACALAGLSLPAAAQTEPFNPLLRDPNAAGLNRNNSNLGTPARTESLLNFGASAQVRRIDMAADRLDPPADGRALVRVTVKLLDEQDKPVAGDVPVLLEATRGRIVAPGQGNTALEAAIDRDKTALGIQAQAKGGEFSFDVVAPGEPGEAQVRVSVGARQQTLKLNFVPDLREMIAVGLIEGIIHLRDQKGALQPARPSDGFEQEIRRFSRQFSGQDGAAGVRAAFFLKGRVSGATLLTAAYDSDKDVRGRMFRDIRADEFYPVYGDASIKGYDAQTSGRFFVRVDNGKHYALYGDFNTAGQQDDALQLGRYSRSLTGAQGHWENARGSLTVFASKDNLRQVVDEIPGKGISGPYNAKFANGVQNTEKVEIIVRDRNAPAVILRITPQVRLIDYDFEPFSGRILFKSPVPSLDENLNPVSIRISYEVEEGGPKYWVGGLQGSVKLGEQTSLGASYAKDENPLAKMELAAINAQIKLGQGTRLLAEVARSEHGDVVNFGSASAVANNPNNFNALTAGAAQGNAWRAELQHQSERLQGRLYVQRADAGFSNPSASVIAGRGEAGGKATYALTDSARVIAEAVASRDLATDGKREGASLGVAIDFSPSVTVEVGVRHAQQSGAGATLGATPFYNGAARDPITGGQLLDPNSGLSGTDLNAAYRSTSAHLKGTWRPTGNTSVFIEGEQDIENSQAHGAAVGGDYRFSEVGRLYARSEWARGLAGRYSLAGEGRQSATVIGVDAQYMKDGQVFSEYRLRDAIAGREAVAAMGLRNYWPVGQGIRLNTTLERVKVIDGSNTPQAKAAGVGIDYTASTLWKGSARVEWREDSTSTSWLSTAALARKLSQDWTVLARNYSFRQNFDSGDVNRQNRVQVGFAWRETATNVWDALGKYEHRREFTRSAGLVDIDSTVHVFSVDAQYHPRRPVWFAGKLAGKWRDDLLSGQPDTFKAQLLQGRVIWDITNRWDLGLIGSVLTEGNLDNRRWGIGVEAGRILMDNLWVSVGYNFKELKDQDLLTDYSSKGAFIRLRYKFDENVFKRGDAAANRTLPATE